MATDVKAPEILENLRQACFKHGMEVGQEFPDESPDNLTDPCNAVEREKALQALNEGIMAGLPEKQDYDKMYPKIDDINLRFQLGGYNQALSEVREFIGEYFKGTT